MNSKGIRPPSIATFRKVVWKHWKEHGRHSLPWRRTHNPYRIMVSEVMLQQTQVARVIPKYREFLKAFPTIQALARADLKHVLFVWSGLGYNRRAKSLREAARHIADVCKGRMPRSSEELQELPGIGPYTARAIATFSYDAPEVFIETNIRTVFIHHFFPNRTNVHDRELVPIIAAVGKNQPPRAWYAALMDYGAYLKLSEGNVSRRSTHHARQARFIGSNREARGRVLKALHGGPLTASALGTHTGFDAERIEHALRSLHTDGLVVRRARRWMIA